MTDFYYVIVAHRAGIVPHLITDKYGIHSTFDTSKEAWDCVEEMDRTQSVAEKNMDGYIRWTLTVVELKDLT